MNRVKVITPRSMSGQAEGEIILLNLEGEHNPGDKVALFGGEYEVLE